MRLIVVSDLHIWGPEDPMYAALIRLLETEAAAGDTVVLAGDLFDLFIGHKPIFLSRYQGFFDALAASASRGVKIHYIEGNHDFLMRKAFQGIPNMELHSREVVVEMEGKRFFVAHGDLVNRSDYSYRLLRGFFRSPVMRAFVRLAPGSLLDAIGQRSSRRSRAKKPLLTAQLPTERMQRLRLVYRNYAAERLGEGFDFVVLGHCHDLDEKHFKIGTRCGQYINVGYPRVHGSFLSWSPGDTEIQRRRLPEVS